MNRRKFLATTGTITLGGGISVNSFSQSALAFDASITDNATIPENVDDPQVRLEFNKFDVTVRNIKNIDINLKAGVEGNDSIKKVDSVSKTLDDPNGVNNLEDVSLVISSGKNSDNNNNELDLKSELSEKNEGEKLELTVEIVVENSETEKVSTGKKNIDISISENQMPDIEPVHYFDMEDNDTPEKLNDTIGSKNGSINGEISYSTTEVINGSYSLHNTDDDISNNIAIDPLFPTGGSYTAVAWLYPETDDSGRCYGDRTNYNHFIDAGSYEKGKWTVYYTGDIIDFGTVPINEWVMATMSYSNNNLKVYINEHKKIDITASKSTSNGSSGIFSTRSFGSSFVGYINGLRLWDVQLEDAEISNIFDATKP